MIALGVITSAWLASTPLHIICAQPGLYNLYFALKKRVHFTFLDMADEELEAIRRQRMAELQAKHGVSDKLAINLN